MKRVHKRHTLKKNASAYYKAFENIINLSQFKHTIFQILPTIIGNDKFDIVIDEKGQHSICLEKLEQSNILTMQTVESDGEEGDDQDCEEDGDEKDEEQY